MNITPRQIDIFRAVMTAGSVTGAAAVLFTSQPTVSRELARLEELIGIPLFDRVRGRLQPNAQALALYEEVRRSYVGFERVAGVAARLKQFASGRLSVIGLPAFSQTARIAGVNPYFSGATPPRANLIFSGPIPLSTIAKLGPMTSIWAVAAL